jgi:hypothetical protein
MSNFYLAFTIGFILGILTTILTIGTLQLIRDHLIHKRGLIR